MRPLLIAVLILVSCAACFAQGHFSFAGPMSQSLKEGATPGAVTGGLPFAVVLSNGGAAIAPTQFDLSGPGWAGKAHLTLANAQFAGGHLTATVQLQNGSDSVLEGLRLDITGATEEYKAQDDQGHDLLKTRPQAVTIPSPLLLGDLQKDEAADPQPLDASTITFQPETTTVTVNGVLSGLYLGGVIAYNGGRFRPISLDIDSQGRLYVASKNDGTILRCDADGQGMVALTKLPDEATFIAVDPTTGDLVGVWSSAHNAMRYTAGGDDVGQLPAEGQFHGWAEQVRFDRAGNLYIRVNDTILCYTAGQEAWSVQQVGLYPFSSPVFDVDADGNLWVGDNDTLFKVGPGGKGGKRVALGPGWHLGQVTSPLAVRVDPHGNVYVIEGPARANAEVQRISVFDRDGKFVRVFGRGAKTPKADGEWAGQISNSATDLAFGTDGRVYVANEDGTAGPLLVFRPF